MITPSEVLSKRCHACEVTKPITEFLTFATGVKAGDVAVDCIKCSSKQRYHPLRCTACGLLRPMADFDKTCPDRTVCRVCIAATPDKYTKTCSTCGTAKPASEFYFQSRTVYINSRCKKCENRRSIRTQAARPRDVVAKSRKRHTGKLKSETYAAYGGAMCVCCGETERSFLSLDHIHNDGAAWRREIFGGNKGHGAGLTTYEWCKRNGYPPIFQVLCWNCQQGKRFNGGICPHKRNRVEAIPSVGVESSDSKRSEPQVGYDMVRHSLKGEIAQYRLRLELTS